MLEAKLSTALTVPSEAWPSNSNDTLTSLMAALLLESIIASTKLQWA